MESSVDHGLGLIKTAAIEQTVAPIAAHLCLLVLLSENAEEPEQFVQLEEAARVVAKATENMASAASRLMNESEDEVMQMQMSALLEPVAVSGHHVVLVAQKLSIQPGLPEHREELIAATQHVLLGVVKVLLVSDDATVRKILVSTDRVLECLSAVGSSHDIKSLLKSFQEFSDALLLLSSLTAERANSLQDPRQTKSLLDSIEILSKCISMLHTAMCTTIKHPASDQARAAKGYILDKVESTVKDIIDVLGSNCDTGSQGPRGFYITRRKSLLNVLDNPSIDLIRNTGFDSMVRDLVFHCMLVANSSRSNLQQRVVGHCRHILQFWSEINAISKFSEEQDGVRHHVENICTSLKEQLENLDEDLMTTVLYQVLDAFLFASCSFEELVNVAQSLDVDSPTEVNQDFLQSLLEDFIAHIERVIQVAHFVSAMAVDAKSLENLENSCTCLTRLRVCIESLSLELGDHPLQTVQRLQELCEKWEEEDGQLRDAISDVVDVREFTGVAINEMINDHRACDATYKEQNHRVFIENAGNLNCHMKQVIDSVKRHLDRSDNPIYRNGLLVLLKKVRLAQTQLTGSVRDMLAGSRFNREAYYSFSEYVSTAIRHLKVLREGLDGRWHPHLLSPLRENARSEQVVLPPPHADEEHLEEEVQGNVPPSLERDLEVGPEEECKAETVEAAASHKYDSVDLTTPAVSGEPKPIHGLGVFDLLPLLYEVVTVTKAKDVTGLNQACTGVLRLSNCYAQAAKEASSIVDASDSQTLDGFRAELVSLTPLLVQTAQETAMSSGMSADGIFKHSAQFSDLINNMRQVLLPVAGAWYHAIQTVLRDNAQNMATTVAKQLSEVMSLATDVVQLLTRSDVSSQSGSKESFTVLHSKLNKAQNNTKILAELSGTVKSPVDALEGPCMLWALSIHILLDSLDTILDTSSAVSQLTIQKKLSKMSENSLRIQEAARLTSLTCKSVHKAKQLTEIREELKILTENYLQVAEDFSLVQSVVQLGKSEFFQRNLLIEIRVLCGQLRKTNKDYVAAILNIVNVAVLAAKPFQNEKAAEEVDQQFEKAAQLAFENVQSATKRVEDCLNYVRDPRSRCNLRSINDHLSFQISDIVSRARLIVETHSLCDGLSLEVQMHCWSAKAHYLTEEIYKIDGIQGAAKDDIKRGLQGKAPENASGVVSTTPCDLKEANSPTATTSWPKIHIKNVDTAKTNTGQADTFQNQDDTVKKHVMSGFSLSKEASSLSYTSLFLKQETESWDPQDNRIVQVTRQMADRIYFMTQYLKKKGPIANKEAFVTTAKEVMSNCRSVTQFVRVIANHCTDKQCTVELSLIVEQILTITNQLSIISSVNAVTPGCKSSDEILVKNAQNLLKTVLQGVHAAETACIKGLRQPEPNSDGSEATALCFQWRRNLEMHRAQQNSNPETDDLGLRKTSPHLHAPSLAPSLKIQ